MKNVLCHMKLQMLLLIWPQNTIIVLINTFVEKFWISEFVL